MAAMVTTLARDLDAAQYKNFVDFAKPETSFTRFLLTLPLDAENLNEKPNENFKLAVRVVSRYGKLVFDRKETVVYDGADPIFAEFLEVLKPLITDIDFNKFIVKENDENTKIMQWEINEEKHAEYFEPLLELIEKDLKQNTQPFQEEIQNAVNATLARFAR